MAQEFNELLVNLLRNTVLSALLKSRESRIQKIIQDAAPNLLQRLSTNEDSDQTDAFMRMLVSWLEESVSPENFQSMWLEIIICRNVEVFDYYISQMLTKVFTQRREILNSSEFSVKMSDILQCGSIDEVVKRTVENRVQQLGYKGLSDIIKYLNEKLGLDFDTSRPDFKDACELFQTRNIIVHNAARINETYLQSTKRTDLRIGERYPLTEEYAQQASFTLADVGMALEQQFNSHFSLT